MSNDGSVVACGRCREIIEDVNGPDVVRLQCFAPAPATFDEPGERQWIGYTPEVFHRRCAPPLSQTWRAPEE